MSPSLSSLATVFQVLRTLVQVKHRDKESLYFRLTYNIAWPYKA